MQRILITGATGTIGRNLLHFLQPQPGEHEVICAVTDLAEAKHQFEAMPALKFVSFNFEDPSTFEKAFSDITTLFLLRPPHISDVEKVFRPLLQAAKKSGIGQVAFLSVQGVENSSIIPHHKIEGLVRELNFEYIFVRPGYFMQNLTSALLDEVREEQQITLPAGQAKFNWIDAKNIGEAAARLIESFEHYKNKPYVITGSENLDFTQVTNIMTTVLGRPIHYRAINPVSFFFRKKKQGMPTAFAMVMTFLHFIPRFQAEPKIHQDYHKITGKQPTPLVEFLEREREIFLTFSN